MVASCRLAAATLHAARVPPPRLAPGARPPDSAGRHGRVRKRRRAHRPPPGSPIGRRKRPRYLCAAERRRGARIPGRAPGGRRAGAYVHDDPRDAAVRATARRCTLSLKQASNGLPAGRDTRKKLPKLIIRGPRRRPTRDRASSSTSSRFAIVSALSIVVTRFRGHQVPRVGTARRRAGRPRHVVHYFSLRDH